MEILHILEIFLLLISLIYSLALLPSITQTIAVARAKHSAQVGCREQKAAEKFDFSRQKIAWAPIFRLFLRAKS